MSDGTVTVRGTLNTLRIVFGALVMSVLLYVVVAHIAIEPEQPPEGSRELLLPLALAAAACGLAAPFVRRALLPPRAPHKPGEDELPTTLPSVVGSRLLVASVIGWAFAESVTIFGLVLGFLTHNQPVVFPFAGGSLALFALLAPRRSLVEEVARAARTQAQ